MEHRRFSARKLHALSFLLVAFVAACADAPPEEERASRSSRFQGPGCEDNNDPACQQRPDPPFPDPFFEEPPNDPCINDPACMKNPCEANPFSPECAPSDPNPDPPPLDPLPERPCERFAGGCRD